MISLGRTNLRLLVGLGAVVLTTVALGGVVATSAAVTAGLADGDPRESGVPSGGSAALFADNVTGVTDCLAHGGEMSSDLSSDSRSGTRERAAELPDASTPAMTVVRRFHPPEW